MKVVVFCWSAPVVWLTFFLRKVGQGSPFAFACCLSRGPKHHMTLRLFKRLGVLLGSLHVVLYFAVPVYGSYLDVFAIPLISLPVMFFFGYWWPLLMFFAFAPRRFHEEPETQDYLRGIGRAFHVRAAGLPLRIVALILLWPFSIMNFDVLYKGLQA